MKVCDDDERMNQLLGRRQAPSRLVILAERGFNPGKEEVK
jgi:hypothetical protein